MLLLAFLTVTTLFVSLIGFLPEQLKTHRYLFLYALISACFPLSVFWGQSSTYIVLFLSLSFIFFSSSAKAANIAAALFGYLLNVTANHILQTIFFCIFSADPQGRYSTLFQILFSLFQIPLTLGIRKLFLPHFSFLANDRYRFFCIALIIEEVLCCGIYIYIFVFNAQLGFSAKETTLTGLLFLLLFFSTVVLLLLISKALHKEFSAQQKLMHLQTLTAYTSDLEKLHKMLRIMNHDYKNLFSAAYAFIDNNDLEGLRAFYQKSLSSISKDFDSSNKQIGNLGNIKIPEIKGLLYSKALSAITLNLNLQIRIDYEVTSVSVSTTDLVRILGIYLDNAMEAAAETDEKDLFLYISKHDSATIWKIINSFSEEVPLSAIYEYGFSTKGTDRGIGLYTAREILNQYPHILSNTNIENHHFVQTLQNI